jgi:hypothetical protein
VSGCNLLAIILAKFYVSRQKYFEIVHPCAHAIFYLSKQDPEINGHPIAGYPAASTVFKSGTVFNFLAKISQVFSTISIKYKMLESHRICSRRSWNHTLDIYLFFLGAGNRRHNRVARGRYSTYSATVLKSS